MTGIATPTLVSAAGVDVDALLGRWRRMGLVAIALWLATFVLWALWAPISGAVVGQGLVKVEANRLTVTHRDGGTVAQVLVKEGESVTKGQELIVLEDTRVTATVDALQAQLSTERLRRSRLEAEAALQPDWGAAPPAELSGGSAREREAWQRERSAFQARRRTWLGQVESVRSQLLDVETEIAAQERNIVSTTEAVVLLKEELDANEALLKENFVHRARILTIRRGISEYDARMHASQAELSQARQRRAELKGRIESLRDAYVQAASEDLREVSVHIVDIEERLRAAQDSAGRQIVVAPGAGRLVDLRVNTVGSAIAPLEPVVDIVPADSPLVIELRLAPSVSSDVATGQAAEVKLLSGQQRAAALLPATVTHVAGDALTDPRTGMAYVMVRVEVAPQALDRLANLNMAPGMAAEVYIKTVERSALGFLLDPLMAGMRRGFREH